MDGSGVLESVIYYQKTNKDTATHFVLCNEGKIRYFISLMGGKKRLSNNLSSYSRKMQLLMKMINGLPFQLLQLGGLGYFVKAKFCDEVWDYIKKTSNEDGRWNAIVGTYDPKQKLVVQFWKNNSDHAIYFKIGNKESAKGILAETEFLKSAPRYRLFAVPGLIGSQTIDGCHKFNIQVSKEFIGGKVEPILTDSIYKIYKELVESKGVHIVDGISYGFSHGDFAPWNMKKNRDGYLIFDWEHCDMRFYGFDLIHYVFQIEHLLNGKSEKEALLKAIEQAKEFDGQLAIDNIEQFFFEEYRKIHSFVGW